MPQTNLLKFNGGTVTQEQAQNLIGTGDFVIEGDSVVSVRGQGVNSLTFADQDPAVLNDAFGGVNSLTLADQDTAQLNDALALGQGLNSLTAQQGDFDPVVINDAFTLGENSLTRADVDDLLINDSKNETFRNQGTRTVEKTDWRFRVSLSPTSDYLYNHPNASTGLLKPLIETDGVLFPYTPNVFISNQANYESYSLTHSNHRGYFYQGSQTGDVIVNGVFTAQDTAEAEYMLAAMTFFKAATKMFYGQDKRRGTPPPLLYMRGFGEFQFNEHPCVLSNFTYTLPDNVDYVRAYVGPSTNNSYTGRMQSGSGGQSWSGRISRLVSSGLSGQGFDFAGAFAGTFGIPELDLSPGSSGSSGSNNFTEKETYVPSEIQFQLTFMPVQTRDQVSNEFSLEDYASGKLIRKGYW